LLQEERSNVEVMVPEDILQRALEDEQSGG
jgi:hypothetical protein